MLTVDRIVNLLLLWHSSSAARKTFPGATVRTIALIVGLIILATIFLAALLIGGLVVMYGILVHQGMTTSGAVALTASGLIVLLIGTLWTASYKIKTIARFHPDNANAPTAQFLPVQLSSIADAFIDGILRRPFHVTRKD